MRPADVAALQKFDPDPPPGPNHDEVAVAGVVVAHQVPWHDFAVGSLPVPGVPGLFPAPVAGLDLDDQLVVRSFPQLVTDGNDRSAEHAFVVAEQDAVQPQTRIVGDAVAAQDGLALQLLCRDGKALAVVPDLLVDPVVLLAVDADVRMRHDAGIVQAPEERIRQSGLPGPGQSTRIYGRLVTRAQVPAAVQLEMRFGQCARLDVIGVIQRRHLDLPFRSASADPHTAVDINVLTGDVTALFGTQQEDNAAQIVGFAK